MTNQHLWLPVSKLTALAGACAFAVLCAGPLAAQTKDQDTQGNLEKRVDVEQQKKLTLIRSGYTRPGSPSDSFQDGKVVALAWDDNFKGRYLGGTVFFAVYERNGTGPEGDVFGTGHPGIDALFKEGRATDGSFSPAFDLNARFLYVYQVVNDRGLDPQKQRPWRNFRSEDIASATVKLLADPREITSWGHFTNAGFTARLVDRDLQGEPQFAADGTTERFLQMSLSSNPSVLGSLPSQEYSSVAPALSLQGMQGFFGLERGTLNLKNSKAYKELADLKTKGVQLAAWQENMLAAANGGVEPTFVQIENAPTSTNKKAGALVRVDDDALSDLQPVGQNPARGYLRVDWSGDRGLKLGDHSVVFGFTSNLPPADEVLRLISLPQETPNANGGAETQTIALVDGDGPLVTDGQLIGPGTVPTPAASGGAVGDTGFWLAGMQTSGGGGAIVGGGIVAAGFAGPRAPFFGGGGSGSGGGGNGQNPTQFQNQEENPGQNGDPGNTEGGGGGGNGGGGDGGNVVPEPTAIALGLLGMPALYLVLRRRKGAKTPEPVH